MLYSVDFSQPIWRYLYEPLYQRVLTYALANDDTEANIYNRFISLHNKELRLVLLVNIDLPASTDIKSHALIEFVPSQGEQVNAVIQQLEVEKNSKFGDEVFEYIGSKYPNMYKVVIPVSSKQHRAIAKRYKLTVSRVILEKEYADRN